MRVCVFIEKSRPNEYIIINYLQNVGDSNNINIKNMGDIR
jgi:hypothetical protein